MADQGENKTAADDVAGQGRAGEYQPEVFPRQFAGKYQIRHFCRTDHDVGEVTQRHQVSDEDDDPHLGAFHRRDHPHHGGNHPARDNPFGEHLAGVVFHDLAPDFKKGLVGLVIENRQVQHRVGNQQRAHQIAHQHHCPQPEQAPEIIERGLAHDRQHGGQGVFGE